MVVVGSGKITSILPDMVAFIVTIYHTVLIELHITYIMVIYQKINTYATNATTLSALIRNIYSKEVPKKIPEICLGRIEEVREEFGKIVALNTMEFYLEKIIISGGHDI